MNLQQRINLLVQLGDYLLADTGEWQKVIKKAEQQNAWFTREFTAIATRNIATAFLNGDQLNAVADTYSLADSIPRAKQIGLVMAGNIPLVGFHDWLCIFLSGHRALVKPSSKDDVLFRHLLEKMGQWNKDIHLQTQLAAMLRGCDAYIATGSNNTSRYFDYYFGKYPHIIRRNRSSVALLLGNESEEELSLLADDIHLFFGLGCRNVTHLYVPAGYNFISLLEAFKKYAYFEDHGKYKNNYDYQLALHILNNQWYMSSGATLLVENEAVFSPIGQVHYSNFNPLPGTDAYDDFVNSLKINPEIQCMVGRDFTPFGQAQFPKLTDFADGTDTLQFLTGL
jgi:hypothetical protein